MHNSASINLNLLEEVRKLNATFDGEVKKYTECNRPKLDQPTKIFYSSSACMYPEHNQLDPDNPDCREESAYPANPDSEYGWEKLFSERLYLTYSRNHGILYALLATIIYLVPKELGRVEERKRQLTICRKSRLSPGAGWSNRSVGRWITNSFLPVH